MSWGYCEGRWREREPFTSLRKAAFPNPAGVHLNFGVQTNGFECLCNVCETHLARRSVEIGTPTQQNQKIHGVLPSVWAQRTPMHGRPTEHDKARSALDCLVSDGSVILNKLRNRSKAGSLAGRTISRRVSSPTAPGEIRSSKVQVSRPSGKSVCRRVVCPRR